MRRAMVLILALMLCVFPLLAGCSKSADQTLSLITHLDVYKRQDFNKTLFFFLFKAYYFYSYTMRNFFA